MSEREYLTRGVLPHWYMPGAAHFVTYRLVDTLPENVLSRLRRDREGNSRRLDVHLGGREARRRASEEFFREYDRYLDRVCSKDWLCREGIAEIVVENLLFHREKSYRLLEYVVMPNHVHLLLFPLNAVLSPVDWDSEATSDELADSKGPLHRIMHSLKSYTANRINRVLERSGQLWQHESYDHWVRDEDELMSIAEYIQQNPVKAGLAESPVAWPFGSAAMRRASPNRLPVWW